jgi:hypothetical protein
MAKWKEYITRTKQLKPRKLLIKGLKYLTEYDYALDFGAGGLRDTKYMLSLPFKEIDVLDSCEETKEVAIKLEKNEKLNVYIERFEDFEYTPDKYNVINAQFSLPFIKKDKQKEVLEKLIKSLKKEGVIIGNYFGTRVCWNDGKHPHITFYTSEEVKEILKDLELVYFKEKEYIKKSDVDNSIQEWHVIEFIGLNR